MAAHVSADPYDVLALRVRASPEAGAGVTCELRLADGAVGAGEPVRNLVSRSGRRYVPELGSARVEICAP